MAPTCGRRLLRPTTGRSKATSGPGSAPASCCFSTTGRLWSITDGGSGTTLNWSLGSIPNPSIPLANQAGGNPYLWVGAGDGRLYQLDLADADPPSTLTSVVLGAGAATAGSPAMDIFQDIAYVGTEEGRVYAVTLPMR